MRTRTLTLALILVCCLAACGRFPCEEEKISDATSPNRQLTATVIWIGCGAIAKDATWLTLHRTGEKYDRSDDVVFSTVQQHSLEIKWVDDSHLSVDCRGCREDDVRLQVTKKGTITISYR